MLAQPCRLLVLLVSLALMVGGIAPSTAAQSSFSDCATRTSTNASLILPSSLHVTLNGTRTSGPWRIRVFTAKGACAGTAQWNGSPTTLTAWGTRSDDHVSPSPSNAALVPGDTMYVHLLNPKTGAEYTSASDQVTVAFRSGPPHLQSTPVYEPDGIYVLDQIAIRTSLVQRER